MLRLALADVDGAEIDTRELERGGESRTIDTLRSLQQELEGGTSLRLLIGADQMRGFHTWDQSDDILELAEPVVLVRGDDDPDPMLAVLETSLGVEAAARWRSRLLDLPRMSQRSTDIRANAEDGAPLPTGDVPHAVAAYIRAHGLYQSTEGE